MDSLIEARVKRYLRNVLHRDAYECGAIFFNIRQLARHGGYAVDERFARSGLAAGPEARIAASIVDHALGGGGGSASSRYQIRTQINRWVERTPPMGM